MNDRTKKTESDLHIAASAMAIHNRICAMMDKAMDGVHNESELVTARIAVPLMLMGGIMEMMGELISMLEDHKVVTTAEVDAYVARKVAERNVGKPEGWCEDCQRVHTAAEMGEPLDKIAAAIVSMMKAATEFKAAAATASDTEVPPDATLH